MIRYSCPRCSATLESADNQAGVTLLCPGCHGAVQVPAVAVPVMAAIPNRAPLLLAWGITSMLVAVLAFIACQPVYIWPTGLLGLAPIVISVVAGVLVWRSAAASLAAMKNRHVSDDGRSLVVAGLVCAIVACVVGGLALLVRSVPFLLFLGGR